MAQWLSPDCMQGLKPVTCCCVETEDDHVVSLDLPEPQLFRSTSVGSETSGVGHVSTSTAKHQSVTIEDDCQLKSCVVETKIPSVPSSPLSHCKRATQSLSKCGHQKKPWYVLIGIVITSSNFD